MATANQVFTRAQKDLLTAVLNRIIPPEGELPGAGGRGLASFVEDAVAPEPHLRRLFTDGLVQIEITASRNGAPGFLGLPDDGKDTVLREVEASNPEFFEQLVRQTYNGYYTDTQIFQRLGYSLPSVDSLNEPPELLDESLLDQQRKRPPFWTQA